MCMYYQVSYSVEMCVEYNPILVIHEYTYYISYSMSHLELNCLTNFETDVVCLFVTEVCSGGNSVGSDRGSYANPLYYGP